MPDRKQDKQDAAVAETFPASDPPASMGTEGGARAVPPEHMMDQHHPAPFDAVTLRRRFPSQEAAKLALEAMVRDGPVDRHCAELSAIGREIELRLKVPEEDCHRIRALLAHA
ncbi:hypothetical protein [Falsiroseomonas sp. HW251]|uniref:hypothetical protein n=1 Tax=Falsiroseomonas sp. HW251 TaxID=3390998 RepID=UPI003D31DBA8